MTADVALLSWNIGIIHEKQFGSLKICSTRELWKTDGGWYLK